MISKSPMSSVAASATTGFLALALAAVRLSAASGFVFDDRNGNGVRDTGEPGIAAVAVSNGVEVVLTDANGAYSIGDRPAARVFVIKPRGWRPPLDSANVPRFYSEVGASADFPLIRADEPDNLRALILTDPQPATLTQVGYLEHGLVAGVGRRADLAFGVTLGDVVYDRPDYFGAVNAALAKIGIPWYSLPGNHDLSLGTSDEHTAVGPFEATYGPSTYAFHAGPALFVALDDVRPLGGPRFAGGLRSDQFEFLKNVLRGAGNDEWVVLMMHIPLFHLDPPLSESFRLADRQMLFGILKGHKHVLVLSGHTHTQRHVMHGPEEGWMGPEPLHEYNVAAACGGFWGGPMDLGGIPVATCSDGTPPGYAVLGFAGDHVTLDYFPARGSADHQLEVFAPVAVAPRQGYVSYYANVFNADDGWTVEARMDDRAWNTMARVLGWDPSFAVRFLAQDTSPHPTATTRLPDPGICYHLWRSFLPADLPVGRHVLYVRATDCEGRVFLQQSPLDVAVP
jgi:3',5'-cyclic AMP phosphodiesterase CpdA